MLRSRHLWSCLPLFAALGAACDDTGTSSENATEILPEGSPRALAALALLNDPATTLDTLKKGKVTSSAAKAILKHRNGPDGAVRSGDENLFDTVEELDGVKGVGGTTLKRVADLADALGYLDAQERKERSVIFSPQPASRSHNVEVAKIIGTAKTSIDIAMYSYSDANIEAALKAAVQRGVKVRMVFETASEDRKLTGPALASSKSGKLEAIGVDVRWVNKIMHHKFMIVDGPRDDAEAAATATLATGSGNWSNGAATKYDENTLFLTAYPELALRMQREFNTLWEHSRDFVSGAPKTFEASSLVIDDELIVEDPGIHGFFTSDNFVVNGDTFSVTSKNTVADELVRAIEAAEDRILVASGHLRSRPVAEALIAKRATDPNIEIKVYLDGQEYVSDSTNAQQKTDLQACLAAATTESKKRDCLDKGFLFGREVELGGIDVRYKYYAYRWDVSYAVQMHNKVLIIDDALYTGSYNLSDNAEHNTFENMLLFRGPEFEELVAEYEAKFQELWVQGDGKLAGLRKTIDEASTIPIVFDPMSLSWTEIRDLKALIAKECPAVNSEPFRTNAPAHLTCTK